MGAGKTGKGGNGNKGGGCAPGEAAIRLNSAVFQSLKQAVDNAKEIETDFGKLMRICLDCGSLGKVLTAVVSANQSDCKKKKGKGGGGKGSEGKGGGGKGGKGGK